MRNEVEYLKLLLETRDLLSKQRIEGDGVQLVLKELEEDIVKVMQQIMNLSKYK